MISVAMSSSSRPPTLARLSGEAGLQMSDPGPAGMSSGPGSVCIPGSARERAVGSA